MGQFTAGFREQAVQKYLNRGSRSATEVGLELGVTGKSLQNWTRAYAKSPGMTKIDRRPQDWSSAEKWKAVFEFEGLPVDKQGEYLRGVGLHSEHIEAWEKCMQAGLEPERKLTAVERTERAEDRRKIKELEQEIRRKDKALAETAALLILKKKADLIWGTGENE